MPQAEKFQSGPLNWSKVPLLLPLLCVVAGVLVSHHLEYPVFEWAIPVVLICSAIAPLSYFLRRPYIWLRYLSYFAIATGLFTAGFWYTGASHPPNKVDFFAHALAPGDIVGGRVLRIKPGERSVQLQVRVQRLYRDSTRIPVSGKLLLNLPPDLKTAAVRVGDMVDVSERISAVNGPRNPGAFNARNYWASQGIYHRCYLNDAEKWRHTRRAGWGLLRRAETYRRAWFRSFAHYLSGNELAVASALVLGKKDLLTSEVRSAYSDTGAMHVLAVSGLHVGIIFLIISTLLGFLPLGNGRLVQIAKVLLTIVLIWTFALMSGLSASVQRAAIMFSLVACGRLAERQSYLLNTLAAAALLMLWSEPKLLLQVGFQLSFAALIGLVLFATPLQRLLPGRFPVWDQIKAGISASIGAQLGTLPISSYVFHSFPLYFLLSGSAVVIFAYVAMFTGVFHGIAYGITGGPNVVADLSGWVLGRIIELQNAFIYLFSGLANNVLKLPNWPLYLSLLTLAGLLLLASGLNFRRWWRVALGGGIIIACVWFARSPVPGKGASGRAVTVYHLRDATLIDYSSPTERITVGDEIDEREIDYQVQPNRDRRGFNPVSRYAIARTDTLLPGRLNWFVLDKQPDRTPVTIPANTEVILIRNGFRPARLAATDFPAEVLIIVDGSNPYYRYADWESFAAERQRRVWITGRRGAYVREW